MRQIFLSIFLATSLFSCKEENKTDEMPAVNDEQVEEMAFLSYGEKFSSDQAVGTDMLADKYEAMKVGDTLPMTVRGTIEDVCSKKGCWVKLPVGEELAFVKFKDYAFFLPKNSKGKEVVLSGNAYKSITTVDELRHYAEDDGKSPEEIAKITEDEVTLSFMANGALVEEFDNPDVFKPSAE
ncbi:MAG: DUF4920 domain-containing protein [Nonlabens sp.]